MTTNPTVQPHWGRYELALAWQTSETPGPDHTVIVLSSIDSENWVNVTTQGELDTTMATFIHREPLSTKKLHELHYRVIIRTECSRWDSPSVAAPQILRTHEFAAVRQILAQTSPQAASTAKKQIPISNENCR